MRRTKTAHAKRVARTSRHRSPSLEFTGARMVLGTWAQVCEQRSGAESRRVEIVGKLEDVRKAILPRKSEERFEKQEKIPRELVFDEFAVVLAAVSDLAKQLGDTEPDARSRCARAARCRYFGHRDTEGPTRPLLLDSSDNAVSVVVRRLTKPDPAEREVAHRLVADLFSLSHTGVARTISDIRADRKGKGYRLPHRATCTQRYLVAMFMLVARGRNTRNNNERQREIMEALYRSGFHALAIYHLARRVSTMSAAELRKPAWTVRPLIVWSEVKGVCESTKPR